MIFNVGNLSPYPKPPAKPKNKACDCGMRLTHEDILNLLRGTILRCGHCNSLIWFDETFWPDMENQYIRWSKMDGCEPLKFSIWMQRYVWDHELPQISIDSGCPDTGYVTGEMEEPSSGR